MRLLFCGVFTKGSGDKDVSGIERINSFIKDFVILFGHSFLQHGYFVPFHFSLGFLRSFQLLSKLHQSLIDSFF